MGRSLWKYVGLAVCLFALQPTIAVRAADGDIVHVGDSLSATSATWLSRSNAASFLDVTFRATSTLGTAVAGSSDRLGVYGFTSNAGGIAVVGEANPAGTGVVGESTTGTGGQFYSSAGVALSVNGKARFNRCGQASVPKNRNYVDVAVPGGLAANSIVNATIQTYRPGVAIAGIRKNYPTAGKVRIYLTKIASTAAATPVAWFVAEYGN